MRDQFGSWSNKYVRMYYHSRTDGMTDTDTEAPQQTLRVYSSGRPIHLDPKPLNLAANLNIFSVNRKAAGKNRLAEKPPEKKRFLQRVSIACYAERCISHDRFCLTDRPSDRPTVWPSVCQTTPATIMRSSLEDSPMILVSWLLTSARNSKGNIWSEGAEWERGSKNVAKIGNF